MADGATTASSQSTPTLDSAGPAAGLTAIVNAVTGAFASLGSSIKKVNVPLPVDNPLHKFASYDYVLGIAAMSPEDINYPDKSYRKGKILPLICKSANADPGNRISTYYGKYDFFIDNLEITSGIGFEKNQVTNITTLSFDIIEPYSIGLFMTTLQVAAQQAKQINWLNAPFLLTIDYRGETETGSMVSVPFTSRQIPFKFRTVETKVTEAGVVHHCNAMAWQAQSVDAINSRARGDISISGSTVQEMLQTDRYSLQAVWNEKLQELVSDKTQKVADQILILFPKNTASNAAPSSTPGATEDKSSATTAKAAIEANEQIFKALNTTKDATTGSYVQSVSDCNLLGAVSMGYNETKVADSPIIPSNLAWDKEGKAVLASKVNVSPQIGNKRYPQGRDVVEIINDVLLTSEWGKAALSKDGIDSAGFRTWWRIDTQVYTMATEANLASTGTYPQLFVYRVVPYKVHSALFTLPNQKAPSYDQLFKNALKQYNYLYTGKNTDILKFDIKFAASYRQVAPADSNKRSADEQLAKKSGNAVEKKVDVKPLNPDAASGKANTMLPQSVVNAGTGSTTEGKGGGGTETSDSKISRLFHDVATRGTEMMSLNLEILGDPLWIAMSGQGNYTSTVSEHPTLNSDMTVNYQGGEVDVVVNFLTPTDINQTTGMYSFSKNNEKAPVQQFSGLYRVKKVQSHFKGGQFTQTLELNRRPNTEAKTTGANANVLSVDVSQQQKPSDEAGSGTK